MVQDAKCLPLNYHIVFHKLDVNGKGAATRSDRGAEWQISGDLGSGLYRFVNMFAMKKLFSILFPPLTNVLKPKNKTFKNIYLAPSAIYRKQQFTCQATFLFLTLSFKIPIKTTETSQQKYRLVRFFV